MQYECKQISEVYITCIFWELMAMCQIYVEKMTFSFELKNFNFYFKSLFFFHTFLRERRGFYMEYLKLECLNQM